MSIKLLKVKNDECYNCDVRTLFQKVNIYLFIKLKNLCENQECAKHNFIYKQVK